MTSFSAIPHNGQQLPIGVAMPCTIEEVVRRTLLLIAEVKDGASDTEKLILIAELKRQLCLEEARLSDSGPDCDCVIKRHRK